MSTVYNLAINTSDIGISANVTRCDISLRRATVFDSFVIVPDFKISVPLVNGVGSVKLLPSYVGSVYEATFYVGQNRILQCYFAMLGVDCVMASLDLLTAWNGNSGLVNNGLDKLVKLGDIDAVSIISDQFMQSYFDGAGKTRFKFVDLNWNLIKQRPQNIQDIETINGSQNDFLVNIGGHWTNQTPDGARTVLGLPVQSGNSTIRSTTFDASTGNYPVPALGTVLKGDTYVVATAGVLGEVEDQYVASVDSPTNTSGIGGWLRMLGRNSIAFLQRGIGAVYRSFRDKQRDVISVFDFMTPAQIADASSPTPVMDHTVPLQNFFNEIAKNYYPIANLVGNLRVSAKVSLINPKTQNIYSNCTIKSIAAFADTVVAITGLRGSIAGKLAIDGVGNTTWSTRGNYNCLILTGCGDITADNIYVRFAIWDGVVVISSTAINIGYLCTAYCGSIHSGVIGVDVTYSSLTNSGTSGSTSQGTAIQCSSIPAGIPIYSYLLLDSELYFIANIDTVNNIINVYPWVKSTSSTSGTARIIAGSGFTMAGDAQVANIGSHNAVVCGIGHYAASLYPPAMGNFTTQVCGIGLVVSYRSSASVGGSIQQGYWESNAYDIVKGTTALCTYNIVNNTALGLSRCLAIAPRLTGDAFSSSFTGFNGIQIGFENRRLGALSYAGMGVRNSNFKHIIQSVNAMVINLALSQNDLDIMRLFGDAGYFYTVHNTANAGGLPTTVTFNAPTGGTINGTSSVVYNSFNAPPSFTVSYDATGLIAKVIPVSGVMSAVVLGFNQIVRANASGAKTSVVVTFGGGNASGDCILNLQMYGATGVFLKCTIGRYAGQTPVVMYSNASAGTSVAITGSDGTNFIATVTTSVTHPMVIADCSVGGLSGGLIAMPTVVIS
jgi:hypothetical protein